MDIRPFLRHFVILIILSGGCYGRLNPLKDPNICGRPQCDESNTKFNYENTKKYHYDYKMHVQTEFSGVGQNVSDIFLTSSVELHFPRKCEGILKLSSVQVREIAMPEETTSTVVEGDEYSDYSDTEDETYHPHSGRFAEDIESYDLRFSFHDGVIAEVCPNENEPVWVLNFKKGLLSSIQNTMRRFDVDYNTTETDISGICDVVYTLSDTKNTSVIITKTKDLTSCKRRYKTNSILQTTPYDFRQNYAAWPILDSQSYCNISVDHHVYNSVSCYERHQLIPFSNHQNGIVTHSKTHLTLNVEEVDASTNDDDYESIVKRSTLIFDHMPTPKVPHGEIRAARELLQEMCTLGYPDIQRGFPDAFISFLATAKLLSYEALQQLLARAVSICRENGKNHVLNSLPYIGSAASVEIMKEQIIKNLVSSEVAHNWMSSLSFITRPDPQILDALYGLVDYGKQRNEHEFTLGVSAVAHTFCRQNSDCQQYDEIDRLVTSLESDVTYFLDKLNTRPIIERVVVSLKGLGNIGVVTEEFEPVLKEIIENDSLPLEVRLQAVFAHRRLDCHKSKNYFLGIYKNFIAQPEIRIASYLQTMKCPDYLSINKIKMVLENEEVNQVGSFVWSHLTNLAKSASPVRVETQGLLVDGELKAKYKMDIRKFSRNFEHSIFFDEFNFGANTDSNLIFGTDSYLPRTLSFNFTVDLFGESVNLFEMNTRMQGFEKYIESYFGPKGPLNTKKVLEKFSNLSDIVMGVYNNEGLPTYDQMASLFDLNYHDNEVFQYDKYNKYKSNDVKNSLQRKVDELGYDLKYNYDDPRASLGIKIFGNDLKYHTLQGINEVFMAVNKLNPSYITQLLSDKEIAYTKSGIVLDTTYTVPLSCGLPLSLSALGVSSVDLRLSGLWNNPGFRKTQQLDVEAKFKPSVSVDVVTSMQSDFFYGSTGVRVKSNFYSSSSVQTKLKVRGMKLISLHVSLPNDHNEIFSARSELVVMTHDKEIKQKGITKRYTNSTCSWPFIDRAVGLKLCAEYSLPDVSNSPNYPSLILSGPVKVDFHLDKADLTAKNFVFEYRSDKINEISYKSFVFETPGSTIPRIFSGNFTNDHQSYNATMKFQNGERQHSAIGTYKDTELDKRLQFSLNLHGQNNLAVNMRLNTTLIKNGALFRPEFSLIINETKIAGLAGFVKKIEKNEKLQYDVHLLFETKKFQSNLGGFIVRTEASYATKMNLEYRFTDHKKETIQIEGDWADRSQKGKSDIISNFKHRSSAYPKYNFFSTTRFLVSMGHAEAKIDINNAPDLVDPNYNTTIKLTFARFNQLDIGKTMAAIEVTRPRTDTDVKILLKHEARFKEGAENNYLFLVRYAPTKEITSLLSIYTPLGPLYAIDTVLNITVPGFDSCTLSFRINEKNRKEYNLNFRGTWFSNHTLSLKGSYIDRTSSVKIYHQLKLLAQSPSFNDTIIKTVYSRDQHEFKFDTQVEHAKIPYGINLKYAQLSEDETLSYGEIKWAKKKYFISGTMLTNQTKKLTLEIHVDRIRDIIIILRGLSNEFKKEAGIEVKWDANKNPTQKVALSAEFNTPKYKTYNGAFSITYPERTLSGTFDLLLTSPEYRGNSILAWSSNDAITFSFISGSEVSGQAIDMWLWGKLNTPFDGWQNNLLNGGFYYMDNLLLMNSSLLWADTHRIGFEFMGNYEMSEIIFGCEVKAALNSTIKDVPSISAYVKHNHNQKRIDTDLVFKKSSFNESTKQYAMKSGWQFDFNEKYRNISGSIALKTPYDGYKTGALISKFSLSDRKQLKGAADLELEDKKYTLTVEGHIRKLTDNMLIMNITTPIEKFRRIVGRFGLNEKERHFVSEIRAPNGALGVEILFSVNSLSNFNTKFSLETPLESFEKIILIGKIDSQTIDIRGGWNKIIVGFVSVQRMAGINDFEYSYKIYTPIENFKENGIVARCIIYERVDFDVEMSLKLAKYKLGIILFGKPRPKLIQQLGIQKTKFEIFDELFDENPYKPIVIKSESDEEEEEEEDDDDDDNYIDENLLSLTGYMSMDLLTWPTISGEFDIEEIGDYYFWLATIKLPQGNVEIKDRFFFPNYLYANNTLSITTPFKFMNEIKSIVQWNIQFGKYIITGTEINLYNSDTREWSDAGYYINYTTTTDESDLKIRDVLFVIKTPLDDLPSLSIRSIFELEENVYRGNITGKTSTTELSVAGGFESDINFFDISVGLYLSAPLVPHYSGKIYLKKDYSEVENGIKIGFEHNDNGLENKIRLETLWHIDGQHYLNGKCKLHTNMIPIRIAETSILITKLPNPIFNLEFTIIDDKHQHKLFKARASRKKEIVTFDLTTPMQEFRNITMYATLHEQSSGQYNFNGNLYHNSKIYQLNGNTKIYGDIPVEINLEYQPGYGKITYALNSTERGYDKTFYLRIAKDNRYAQLTGGIFTLNKLNWNFNLNTMSTEQQIGNVNVNASLQSRRDNSISFYFDAKTPWQQLQIDNIQINTEIRAQQKSGDIVNTYELPVVKGYSKCSWTWEWLETVEVNLESRNTIKNNIEKLLEAGIQYSNPNADNKNLAVGTNFNVNSIWKFALNGTVMFLSNSDYGIGAVLKLPEPSSETHRLSGRWRSVIDNYSKDVNYEVKYEADNSRKRFGSHGLFQNQTDLNSLVRFEWGPNVRLNGIEGKLQILRKGIRRELFTRVATPMHVEDSFRAVATFDASNIYDKYNISVFIPSSNQVATADIEFASLSNTRGMFNGTTPFLNITWLRGDFDLTTKNEQIKRYIKATWPEDTSIFDSLTTFKKTSDNNRNWQGTINIEVPLATRHYSNIEYSLKENELLTDGNAVVIYNNQKVLTGKYDCKSELRAGFAKDVVDISLENDLKPIGIHYIHSRKQNGAQYSEYDMKHIELFELRKSADFNVTGEVHIRTNHTGYKYKLIAIHPNRTVVLSNDYDFQDNMSKQKTKLQLAENVWIAYNFNLQNLSKYDNESQIFKFELLYPLRNLSANGWYSVTDACFDSDVELKWTKNIENDNENDYQQSEEEILKPGVVHAALLWRNEPLVGRDRDNQTILFTLRHPSFSKDITMHGKYYRSPIELLETQVIVDYSDDPEHLLVLGANIKDLSSIVGYRNYSYEMHGSHKVSELTLDASGSLGFSPGLYETFNTINYKRGYLPLQAGQLIGSVNLKNKEIHYHKVTPFKTIRLWTRSNGYYPIYTINGTYEDSPEINSTGEFYLNIDDKFIRCEVNMTPDASQNLQMIGEVPDARSAYFDVWRDYEDIRVVDIAYYLRMNHSRLVTSQLLWRPTLKSEVQERIRVVVTNFYDNIAEGIEFWKKTLQIELSDSFSDIWSNAKPATEEFLDDVAGLRVIEMDMESLHTFLNQSYEANDFYLHSVVNFTLTVLDELALKEHLQSVPKIVKEIVQAMGDSGKALRESIIWLIQTIKTSYQKAIEILGRFLHGESLEHLSRLMEKAVARYDKFIKDLHLSFIKYVENMYVRIMDVISSTWKRMLQNIEPSILKVAHYIESLMWKISKEVFDFVYKRTNEIVESPYFTQVSNFTQDLDHLYRDIMKNDAITNVKKYTVLGWNFVKDKYFKLVPFGKELHQIFNELLEELKQLQKLESVQFIMKNLSETQEKLEWFADEFQLEKRIQQLYVLLRNKFTRFAQTALQADSRYREAKTKFVFDPDNGRLELEQKLPMSWHAFNETPRFEEIPEYKSINDIQVFFEGSNESITAYYHDIKPLMEVNMWLPPFTSHAYILGSRHYITFDRKFVSLDLKYDIIEPGKKPNHCSLILARDNFNSNFSLIIQPITIVNLRNEIVSSRKITLISENDVISIDVVGDTLRIDNNISSLLPLRIKDVLISRDADVVEIESLNGYKLTCNTQFDYCSFELSGWYFGKTAGLLGTMNNENYDEFLTSSNNFAKTEQEFIDSWMLKDCDDHIPINKYRDIIGNSSMDLINLCDSFFKNKISYFSACFPIVDAQPFYEMCLDLGTNSKANVLYDSHPSMRGACTAALAYIDICSIERTPLRVPDSCIHCDLINGSYVPEGQFIVMEGKNVVNTSDIVFIIEAKPCNHNVSHTKSLMAVAASLNKELIDMNIKNNRFAVITFGGPKPFDKARSIVYNSQVFTSDYRYLEHYFNHIKTGKGDNDDIFQAISVASKLIFRPGASKTMILLPCSECKAEDMRLDYSSLLQLLLENGINLHVLMNNDFSFDKPRYNKMIFGMDRLYAYSKNDMKDLQGDSELRKQVPLPKSTLGNCAPLAIETNGTVFTAHKLRPVKPNPVKKLTTVFAKRVALSAIPPSCQSCECTGHNTGVAYMQCFPCSFPNADSLDYFGMGEDFPDDMDDEDWGSEDDEYF